MKISRQLYEIVKILVNLLIILIVEYLDETTLSLQTHVALDYCLYKDEIWLM